MNKTYRIVWNETTNTWVAVAEIAKAHGKSASIGGGVIASTTTIGTRFAYTAAASAVLMMSTPAMAVTGTGGGSTPNATVGNVCFYDTASQSVVCGDANTAVPNKWGVGTPASPDRVSRSVAMGNGATITETANSYYRPDATHATMYTDSVAIGTNANVKGYHSVAIGGEAQANERLATAIGYGAKANALYSSAMGYKADAHRMHSTAFGSQATITDKATTDTARSNAILASDSANGLLVDSSLPAGTTTSASDSIAALAFGRQATAAGYASMAQGLNAQASAAFSTAIGANSKADKMETIAVGSRSEATGHRAIAIGSAFKQVEATKASGDNAIAMGSTTQASGSNAVAIGKAAQAATDNTIAFGNAAKVSGTTPISNTSTVMSGVSGIAIGNNSEVRNRNYGIAIGDGAFVGTYDQTKDTGAASSPVKHYDLNRGDKSDNAGRPGVAIGWKTQSTGDDSIALGNDSISTGRSSVALGKAAYAEDTDAIAICNNARAG